VYRDERHGEIVLRGKINQDRRHQRCHDHIARCRRHAHAEYEADDCCEEQHDDEAAAGDELHDLGHHQTDAGKEHRADDDAGCRCGDADRRHVAPRSGETFDEIGGAGAPVDTETSLAAEEGRKGPLCHDEQDQRGRAPEGREPGREFLDHEGPDENADRQQKMQTCSRCSCEIRNRDEAFVRIVERQVGVFGRYATSATYAIATAVPTIQVAAAPNTVLVQPMP
jgi:hypothetical protein